MRCKEDVKMRLIDEIYNEITSFLIIFDFLTKKIIFNYIELNSFISLTFFMDITHIQNYGIAFGLFAGIFT